MRGRCTGVIRDTCPRNDDDGSRKARAKCENIARNVPYNAWRKFRSSIVNESTSRYSIPCSSSSTSVLSATRRTAARRAFQTPQQPVSRSTSTRHVFRRAARAHSSTSNSTCPPLAAQSMSACASTSLQSAENAGPPPSSSASSRASGSECGPYRWISRARRRGRTTRRARPRCQM